ncbi:unnamed protein product [Callosobruchus maculatus]|uniref:Uncharacterized protein n=1 Tax=Callosobruchus maculatus TaxID=64391 RepID=A0A653BDR4_CALMS|nr:unnamed protein product [Callosobruchus maculatus]
MALKSLASTEDSFLMTVHWPHAKLLYGCFLILRHPSHLFYLKR